MLVTVTIVSSSLNQVQRGTVAFVSIIAPLSVRECLWLEL